MVIVAMLSRTLKALSHYRHPGPFRPGPGRWRMIMVVSRILNMGRWRMIMVVARIRIMVASRTCPARRDQPGTSRCLCKDLRRAVLGPVIAALLNDGVCGRR